MPHHGDQHKPNGNTTTNPYEEQKRRISEYTAQEIATLQSRLNKRLGPEFISTRPGPGNQKIAYLSAEKAINLANEVFGFNGWSSSIQQIDVDFVEESPHSGKVSMGLSVIVRVTLRDGTFHEDIGYGGIENCKGKAMAFEKSKKEATTDALKRTLRNFGNVLGNCIYDRNFVTQVSKVKAGSGAKFDVNELHRHPDFAPKQEDAHGTKSNAQAQHVQPRNIANVPRTEFDDSFDLGEFDDADFDEGSFGRPDEILLPADTTRNNITTPSKPPQGQFAGHPVISNGAQQVPKGPQQQQQQQQQQQPNQHVLPSKRSNHDFSSPGVQSQHFVGQQTAQVPLPGQTIMPGQTPANLPSGFYSAKAAPNIDQNNNSSLPANATKFNPHAESPSIRKTAGVDHNKSVPVKRDTLKPEAMAPPRELGDSKSDMSRKIGIPGQPGSNVLRGGPSNSSYRPPTRHGSPAIMNGPHANGSITAGNMDKPMTAVKRPPLTDVSNGQHATTAMTIDGADAKRQKLAGVVGIAKGVENG